MPHPQWPPPAACEWPPPECEEPVSPRSGDDPPDGCVPPGQRLTEISSMPQMGHFPGPGRSISGCMGQLQTTADVGPAGGLGTAAGAAPGDGSRLTGAVGTAGRAARHPVPGNTSSTANTMGQAVLWTSFMTCLFGRMVIDRAVKGRRLIGRCCGSSARDWRVPSPGTLGNRERCPAHRSSPSMVSPYCPAARR